ncbi:MAG: SIS domain-containing protein [Deltaproteobacteria bacterium]|nr:SIS domain-containing protein [Deltaproteobacteria bacterium]
MSDRPNKRTVGIGSMVADRIHRVPRILASDQKGIMRAGADGRTAELRVGGVVLNHLGWAAVLGLPVGIFGKQADDANGRFLRDAMDRFGIAKDIVLDGSASSFADIYVDDSGGRAIYMAPGATSETTYSHVRRHHERTIASALRATTEVSQLPLAAANEVCRLAEVAGVPTLVDLDVPPSDAVPQLGTQAELEQLLRRAKILKPSSAAARELVLTASGDALASARKLRERYGNEAVVVTDGEAGCAVATAREALRVPAYAVASVVDTTGAGDAFLGGVLVGLAAGLGWEDIARLGNACGAACVEKLGAFPDDAIAARDAVLARYDGAALPSWVIRGLAVTPEALPANEALVAYDVALSELAGLRKRLDAAAFERVVGLIDAARASGGRVHVTGIGKPEHIARYGAALLASVGTPASFLHATETMHGSAGQVVRGDVVIAISNSGETRELLAAVGAVKALGAQLVAITGAPRSSLAQLAAVVLDAGVAQEGGGLGLAPRASAAAELLVVAALSAALEHARGLTRAEYHALHPAGGLGAKSGG